MTENLQRRHRALVTATVIAARFRRHRHRGVRWGSKSRLVWGKAGLVFVSPDLGMDWEATDQGRFLCCFPIFRFLYLIWVTFRTCICDHCQEVCHFHSAVANRTVFYGRLYRNLWNLIDWTKSPDHRMLYIHWRVSIWLEKCKYFLTDNWSRVVG